MKNNAFELANRRFSNADLARIRVTYLDNHIVRQCLDTVKQAFCALDYSDDYQSRLSLGLFKIRCSILFGLAPYSHGELQLLEQVHELIAMAKLLPNSRDIIARLNEQLKQLLDAPNSKLEWILQQDWEEASGAIFTPMAMGKSFGSHLIAEQKIHHLGVIHSANELGTGKYSTIVVPGTLRHLSYALSIRLLHRGEFAKIHVLLYEGESLDLKSRYELPSSPLFPERSSRGGPRVEISKSKIQAGPEFPLSVELSFGEKNIRVGDPVARLLLFENGAELHVIESEFVHIWRPDSTDGLMKINPVQLMEGDCLVLEKRQRHDLLNLSDEDLGFRMELDTTDQWRRPLNAMLLNHTPREVAILMMETAYLKRRYLSDPGADIESAGLDNLQANVANWANGQVFGPGDISYMRALISVLVKSGLLEINGSIDDVSTTWFSTLQSIRAGRRAAGAHLSSQRDQLLKELLNNRTELEDAEELALSNGMVISLHKLAMVGDPVRVAPDALIKEPIRGALRWLE